MNKINMRQGSTLFPYFSANIPFIGMTVNLPQSATLSGAIVGTVTSVEMVHMNEYNVTVVAN
jgi:hypothetical protein